jgi:peptidoglycan/LPS O-acetylase OafA/YrhL
MTAKDWSAGFTRQFARITTSGRLIPEVDGLRFIAISGILLYHGMQQIAARNGIGTTCETHQGADRILIWLLNEGRLGVQFFFVISGFVLGQQYSENHHRGRPHLDLKHFYLRRLTRLEPPYVVNLLLSYLLVATLFTLGLRAKGEGFSALLPHLGASLVYSHCLIYHDLSTVNGVTWSLEVEAQFYLLMPLFGTLIYLIESNLRRTLAILTVIVIHSLAAAGYHGSAWYMDYSLVGYLSYFLAGILLADLHSAHPDWRERSEPGWDLAALGAVGLMLLSEYYWGYQGLFPLLFGVICQAALCGRFLKNILRLAPIWIVGGMCYSIYLYHLWIFGVGAQILRFAYRRDLPFWMNFCYLFPVVAIVVLAISAAFYVFLERPCMKRDWPERLLRRKWLNS